MKQFTILLMMIFIILGIPFKSMTNERKREAVILLHGLARTKASMGRIENYLGKNGYMVVNMGYPSRQYPIETLSETILPQAIEICNKRSADTIHFVTHSMGGILVRHYLQHHELPNLGRVVMLSPPNKGSQVADKLKSFFVFKWLNGPAGQQLGTGPDNLPIQLKKPYYETGIITGDRSINLILSMLIPGKDDGKVSVENAKLDAMKDFLVVHKSHPFIMNDPKVHRQIKHFLLTGRFSKPSS